MNELSWLLYAADVVGDLDATCAFVTIGGTIGLSIYAGIKGLACAVNSGFDEDEVLPPIGTVAKKLWLPLAIAALLGIVTPSKNTIYAIAASHMGERVLTSATGGKALLALDAWLDKQIATSPAAAD